MLLNLSFHSTLSILKLIFGFETIWSQIAANAIRFGLQSSEGDLEIKSFLRILWLPEVGECFYGFLYIQRTSVFLR